MENIKKFIILVSLALGIDSVGYLAWVFWVFVHDGYIYEPIQWIATTELLVAIAVLVVSLIALVIVGKEWMNQ